VTGREGGGKDFPVLRVMFTGPYGVSANGTYSEWLAVEGNLCLTPTHRDVSGAPVISVASLRPNRR